MIECPAVNQRTVGVGRGSVSSCGQNHRGKLILVGRGTGSSHGTRHSGRNSPEIKPGKRGHSPGMLAFRIGIGTRGKCGQMSTEPRRGQLNEADLVGDPSALTKGGIFRTIGNSQDREDILGTVGTGGIFAGPALDRRGDDRAEVLLTGRVLLGKERTPHDTWFLRLR